MAKEVEKKTKTRRRKQQRNVPSGICHVKASFNNTIVTITDPSGNTIGWATAGRVGYSGSRKSSAFAATMATRQVAKTAQTMGMREIEVNLKGPGSGREAVVRELQAQGINVTVIRDTTPVPHNGCRSRKRRRV